MHPRRFPRGSGPSAAIALACACAASPLVAQTPATTTPAPAAPSSAAPAVPLSPTSQCAVGPGAPPADPTKVTRVVPGSSSAPAPAPAESSAPPPNNEEEDAPDKPAPVRLELGVQAGVSVRADDPPVLTTTRRAGATLGGSAFVWTSRALAFGVEYAHTDLSRSETAPLSPTVVSIDHRAHALLAEARVAPFRFSSLSLFAYLGGGLVWQAASLRATFPPLEGDPGGSFQCSAGSNVEFGFRAGIAAKARITPSVSFLADASFLGYRFSSDVLDGCAPGTGTAQTLVVRAGLTYDIDITRMVR